MLGRVAKIPIVNTSDELVAMGFFIAGTWGLFCTFEILSHDFRRLRFLGTKKKEEQTAEMVRVSAISNWMAVFGTPGIMVGKDSRFIGCVWGDFSGVLQRAYRSFPNGNSGESSEFRSDRKAPSFISDDYRSCDW